VVAASVLAITRPPAFTSPWLGPWVATAAGLVLIVTAAARPLDAAAHNASHV
jgi:hypothetical protein